MFTIEEANRQSLIERRNSLKPGRLATAILTIVFAVPLIAGAPETPAARPHIEGKNLRIEFDPQLRSRIVTRFDKKETLLGPFTASETITSANQPVTEFSLSSQALERIADAFGSGERLTIEGKHGALKKKVCVTIYNDFPGMAFFDVQYTNTAAAKVTIDSWSNNAYTVNAQPGSSLPAFWSYQSGSYEKRPNWVLPLDVFARSTKLRNRSSLDLWLNSALVAPRIRSSRCPISICRSPPIRQVPFRFDPRQRHSKRSSEIGPVFR